MVDKSMLFQAKAFLCWDKFADLAIKLIPVAKSVAFFHPPAGQIATINLFYEPDNVDFTREVCLLFHEAGHVQQWQNFKSQHREHHFWQLLDLDKGVEKMQFERDAWNCGAIILNEFSQKNSLEIMTQYNAFAEASILTYQ